MFEYIGLCKESSREGEITLDTIQAHEKRKGNFSCTIKTKNNCLVVKCACVSSLVVTFQLRTKK